MSAKNMRYGLLLDFYGEILPEGQREMMDLYYNEDCTLAEIAQEIGITRQGVHEAVHRAEETLTSMEDKLGMIARFEHLRGQRTELLTALDRLDCLCQSEHDAEKRAVIADVKEQLTQLDI